MMSEIHDLIAERNKITDSVFGYRFCKKRLKEIDSEIDAIKEKKRIEKSNNKISQSKFETLMEMAEILTGCKTKENLIRYIVCDGEPADESCIGHPVKVFSIDISYGGILSIKYKDEWLDRKLSGISNGVYESGNILDKKSVFEQWDFAKKIPGYDYSKGKNLK